ncbi:phage portal protein [Paenibacillus motobuensis]|uniref:phage tail assembly chaperone n=1 Tax=Paenibacillus TaxID=44249 RepID=UPI00203BB3AB|nr:MULTISPECIES: phage portal protein [Paenibacillus]MCM3040744.1 phage portal protein [Paenibacillus lutimineralis]MCM3647848.1 phage portal protein [Paenibacillus motobuensis]
MSNLSLFFAQNVVSEISEEVIISPRFKNEAGKPVPWKLRSMTEEENEAIRKSAQRKIKERGIVTLDTNSDEYLAKLVVASVVFPDLKDAELQKSYGVLGADHLLRKMLLPGEYATLLQKVQEVNGFDRDVNELAEEVKN